MRVPATGQMAFTVMPYFPRSRAATLVSPPIADFAAP